MAKENIVGTMGILYGASGNVYATLGSVFTGITGYSFLVFNLLCAPCFAAIGAIKREMNNAKWTWGAIGYMCGLAYLVSLIVYQLGMLFTGNGFTLWTAIAALALIFLLYMLFRKNKYDENHLNTRAVDAAMK